MTIDSKGIKSIDRSGCSAAVSQSPFNVYTTIGIKHNFIIKFQYGISRLALTPQAAELQITDLPNLSPSLGFQFPAPKHSIRLAATNLDRCSGITFFLSTRNLRAIHAHNHTTPIADTTFAQIHPAVHRSIC
ncbi:uncharacterized protein RAG0_05626 [Rhynchosporium agropyri]|uniref:Uncharacterized protein n=1 Tax=Rhynchosporium agropyri TaxID=914238 RepID=A0A1E1KDY5_9HELO|nr:uncharacterized protein RAG0_05626 [Rhynchosporium agropyri]